LGLIPQFFLWIACGI